jgi:hypothetical protein
MLKRDYDLIRTLVADIKSLLQEPMEQEMLARFHARLLTKLHS